ncbi:gamma-glutamylcyclotransferase [Neokomagataea tanensis]|uniref:Gamma-glutamylcyclotransferase n=1 Tax=Neokomagataea tanensis TaxID=661191 RepID=A0A4Y6V726_9PROT|nr:gamma-glutamylcyclotransferase [Neokomagataea tanensis]
MNNSDGILLFSYGTLQLEKVQMETFGRLLSGTKDAMLGYRTDLVEITDPAVLKASGQRFHPVVVPTGKNSDMVEGTVFVISAAELAAADSYEVSDYKRVEVLLQSGKAAWVYIGV